MCVLTLLSFLRIAMLVFLCLQSLDDSNSSLISSRFSNDRGRTKRQVIRLFLSMVWKKIIGEGFFAIFSCAKLFIEL